MERCKHRVSGSSWRREHADQAMKAWYDGISWGHEISVPHNLDTAKVLIGIHSILQADTAFTGQEGLIVAQTAIAMALHEGPRYRQHVLCAGYDDQGIPNVIYL